LSRSGPFGRELEVVGRVVRLGDNLVIALPDEMVAKLPILDGSDVHIDLDQVGQRIVITTEAASDPGVSPNTSGRSRISFRPIGRR